jgi:CRISPR/Cas system endoribonuclease Cas6 (RAMP superfamily)
MEARKQHAGMKFLSVIRQKMIIATRQTACYTARNSYGEYMMQQVDLMIEACDTRNLHPQLSVKLHGALMRGIRPELADDLHSKALRPYSLFTAKRSDNLIMRISTLSAEVQPLLNAAMQAEEFRVSGIHTPVRVSGRAAHPAVSAEALLKAPPLRNFRLELASPAVYRSGNAYRNMFSMEALLLTVAEKLNKFETYCIDKSRIKMAVEGMRYRSFAFRSAVYEIKHSVMLPACTGSLEASLDGPPDESAELSLLLRYAAYAGLGARTALGMGGIFLEEI